MVDVKVNATFNLHPGTPNVARIVHLMGGARATNSPGLIAIVSPPSDKGTVELRFPSYGALGAAVDRLGVKTLGVQFIEHSLHAQGLYPPTWRPLHRPQNWLVEDAIQIWSQLANAGSQNGDVGFMDLSRRIGFGLQAASWRLLDLSNAYNKELVAICSQGKFRHTNRSVSQNSFRIYIEAHSFFSEVASLRDYLAEYTAGHILPPHVPSGMHIRLMAKLRKHVLVAASGKHPVADSLLTITTERTDEGWLAQLSAYRDLITHYTPLAQATPLGTITEINLPLVDGASLPTIRFPMPPDPFEAKRSRSRGAPYENMEAWHSAVITGNKFEEQVDAPEYCHSALGLISNLALELAKHSPYAPKMRTIKTTDMIGPPVYSAV